MLAEIVMKGFYFTNVPYRSQWASREILDEIIAGQLDAKSDKRLHEFGFATDEEYAFWSRRTCGLACLEAYLLYLGLNFPSRAELVKEMLTVGAYVITPQGIDGLFYKPFVDWLGARYGIVGSILPLCGVGDLLNEVVSGSIVLCSVSTEIRCPQVPNQRKGGHLVLVHGIDEKSIRFHNPSGFRENQENVTLDRRVFERFFAGRGISLPVALN